MKRRKELNDQDTVLFIGDSITDCGRREHWKPLGNGYVQFFHDLWLIRNPGIRLNIINKGISGNTVHDLRNRWHEDVILKQPNWLSVKIGINDLNRHLGQPEAKFVDPEAFEETYDRLITATRSNFPTIEILLIGPFYISTDSMDGSYRKKALALLDKYVKAVGRLADKHQTRFLNLHAVFQERLKLHHADVYCPEPVHPNGTGHLLMAEEVYRVLTQA